MKKSGNLTNPRIGCRGNDCIADGTQEASVLPENAAASELDSIGEKLSDGYDDADYPPPPP
jgi:hypothetical protein